MGGVVSRPKPPPAPTPPPAAPVVVAPIKLTWEILEVDQVQY